MAHTTKNGPNQTALDIEIFMFLDFLDFRESKYIKKTRGNFFYENNALSSYGR